MANYTAKLVDRTLGSTPALLGAIQTDAQSLFDEALAGTQLQIAVSWGAGTASDAYVVHFVEDKSPAHSYLLQNWPNTPIKSAAGGFTWRNGPTSGSEVYKFADASRTQSRGLGYAKLVLHEFFHNQFPRVTGADVHGSWGGGGLAAEVPVLAPPPDRINQRNKELILRGLSVKTAQLL